jgi:uncharacterized protein
MYDLRDIFILNVGFIVHETIGYVRDIPFDLPEVDLPPDLTLSRLRGTARVTRTPQGLLLQLRMEAGLQSECGRCLTEFIQMLRIDSTELYAFNKSGSTESGLLVPENGKIDLAPLIREEMVLAIPINPLCRPDCKGLCPECGEDLNEHPHTHEELPVDPRLAALNVLLQKGSRTSS